MPHRTESDLTRSILQQVLSRAHRSSLARIEIVNLVLGEIADLDRIVIQSHWNELSQGTLAERSQLRFRHISAAVQCMSCFGKYHPEGGVIHCPYCGSFGAKILAGEECYLESVE